MPDQTSLGRISSFTRKFYQTYKEERTPILLQIFQETEEEETLPNSFYEVTVTPTQKIDKDTARK